MVSSKRLIPLTQVHLYVVARCRRRSDFFAGSRARRCRRVVGGEAEHGFERDVPVKSAIVAKHEFIEVGIDVLASQAVIRAERPALHQRERTV